MSYETVIQKKIETLAQYRNSLAWRRCVGEFAGPEALNDSAIEWVDQGHTLELPDFVDSWFRARFQTPKEIGGVSVAGSSIQLRCFVISPTEVFINGEKVFQERFWSDFQKPEVSLTAKARPGDVVDLVIHIKSCPMNDSLGVKTIVWQEVEVVEDVIFELEAFLSEISFLESIPGLAEIRAKVIAAADATLDESMSPARMMEEIAKLRATMEPARDLTKRHTMHLVAHAHIDMNWLWDMRDTIDVCRRDFTTMTQLMEEFPDFSFSQSQTSVYDIAEREFPEVFAKMKAAVKRGKWDVTAATWTEGDLNMGSGEAITRHLLYSRRYHQDHFNTHSRVCWEPDTFGHPATIPQLMKKSGVSYYYHMRTTEGHPRFFHQETPLYWWEGDDGSRLLAFSSYYNGVIHAPEIVRFSRVMKEKHGLSDAIWVYGVGDHGGGPTRRDLRRAQRLDSLAGMPRCAFSTTHAFFDAVSVANPLNLPVWKGEMNPVFDGCYTTHADIKRNNRTCENRLVEAETAAALALLKGRACDPNELEQAWRTVLFNQFHDIFDGCAIHSTYELAARQAVEVLATADRVRQESLDHLTAAKSSADGMTYAVWNLQGFSRTDLVEITPPEGVASCLVIGPDGEDIPAQVFDGKLFFVAPDVPALGCKVFTLKPGGAVAGKVNEDDRIFNMESDAFEVHVEKRSGCIVWLKDKATGKLFVHQKDWYERKTNYNNLFTVDYEIPHGMSAWVIGGIARTDRLIRGAEVKALSSGPVMDVLEITHRTGKSEIHQRMLFHKQLRRIDFRTHVDWRENADNQTDAPMLRVSFMPELKGTLHATWDVPFGSIERPTDGTEYAAQKWMDVSDGEFGLSLLNDSKYGFNVNGHTLSMTCLRTPYSPDPSPDLCEHDINYAIVPHAGNSLTAGAPRLGAAFNSPLVAVKAPAGSKGTPGRVTVEGDGVLMTAFKKAEDCDALILRVVETQGKAQPYTILLNMPVTRVEEIAPTEDRVLSQITMHDGVFSGVLASREIKTWRLWL